MEKSFRGAVEKYGGKVIQSDGSPFPNTTGDFSQLLLKAAQLKPQVLGAMQAGGDLVNVVKQYNEFKLKDQNIKLASGLHFDADAVVKQLEGYKFSDFFIRNGLVRPEDHWVQHDALLAQVKPSSEAKEKFDYSKVLATIPAETASRPLADAGCKMPK